MQLPDSAQMVWLEQRTPLLLDWTPGLHAAAREAARDGNIGVLRTLLARSGFHLTSNCDGPLNGKLHHCSRPDCIDIMQHYACGRMGNICGQTLEFCVGKLKVYKAAASAGQLPVLAWLFGQVHPFSWHDIHQLSNQRGPYWDSWGPGLEARVLSAAAATEQLQVLAWLHKEMPSDLWSSVLLTAFKAAAWANRLPAVIWLHDHSNPKDWTTVFSSEAAETGHLDILRWLCLECVPPCPVDELTMAFAAGSGKLESLQLLRSLNPPCPMDESATGHAMWQNQLGCLAWLRSQDPPCAWYSRHMTVAAGSNALEGIKMARALEPPCDWDSDAILEAIRWNYTEVLAWLLEHGAPHPDAHELRDALAVSQTSCSSDPMMYVILDTHRVPLPVEERLEALRIRASWCTFMGLVRWARRTQPLHHGSGNPEGIVAGHQAQHTVAGSSLLAQIACLPDELVRHIGAAARLYYQKGGKVFCQHVCDEFLDDMREQDF